MTNEAKTPDHYKQLAICCAVYCGLAFLVLLPLLRPGFVLTLDMVFAPKIEIPAYASGPLYIFWGFLHVLNGIIPSATIQKLILFGILFLSGFGMHRFLQKIGPRSLADTWQWGCYFGGLMYMINPFTYSRFMAGQFAVLLGYALVPFFAVALIRFCSKPERKTAGWLVGWISLIAIISLHALGLLAVITLFVVTLTAAKVYKIRAWRKAFLKWSAIAILATLVVNSYWLIPSALGRGTTAEIVGSFTQADQQAFATDPGHLGLFGNVLAMQGFWGESKNLFMVPADSYSWWLVPIVLLWCVIAFGIVTSFRSRRNVTTMMLLIVLSGVVLGIGTAGTFVAPFNEFLVQHVPFFAGYREPQKFVGLIVFGYSYFGAVAVARLAAWLEDHDIQQHVVSVMTVLMIIPLLGSSLMIWGFHGQLRSADYPVQWYAVRDMLDATCTGDCKILFLPWHLYMRYDFAGRIVASPAQKFFGNRIVSSNDPEMDGATAYRTSSDQKDIGDTVLPAAMKGDDKNFITELKQRHIKFVILVKENDYKKYDFLNDQKGLKVVQDIPTIKFYEVQ